MFKVELHNTWLLNKCAELGLLSVWQTSYITLINTRHLFAQTSFQRKWFGSKVVLTYFSGIKGFWMECSDSRSLVFRLNITLGPQADKLSTEQSLFHSFSSVYINIVLTVKKCAVYLRIYCGVYCTRQRGQMFVIYLVLDRSCALYNVFWEVVGWMPDNA